MAPRSHIPYRVFLCRVQVWHVRVDVHVLDHAGNVVDAALLAALAALLAFRRPDASVAPGADGEERGAVTLHAPDVREPLPLSLHHLPLAITFGLFEVRSMSWRRDMVVVNHLWGGCV